MRSCILMYSLFVSVFSRLELLGPCSYVLSVNEELYEKSLSNIEYKALKKAAVPSFLAYSLTLEKNQAVCIVDVQVFFLSIPMFIFWSLNTVSRFEVDFLFVFVYCCRKTQSAMKLVLAKFCWNLQNISR